MIAVAKLLLEFLHSRNLISVGIGQGLTLTGYSNHRIEMVAFSLPFFIKGLKALKFKSDGDNEDLILQPPENFQ